MRDLQEWIKQELTVDVNQELSKHKENVKRLLRLTPSGEIILVHGNLSAKQKILLYFIGKVYSKIANFSKDASASNKELAESLGLPEGTVKSALFSLRKEGFLIPIGAGTHQIKIERIGSALDTYFGELEK